jgi:hypothetical protein
MVGNAATAVYPGLLEAMQTIRNAYEQYAQNFWDDWAHHQWPDPPATPHTFKSWLKYHTQTSVSGWEEVFTD